MNRKIIRKLLLLIIAAVVIFAGCSGTENENTETISAVHRVMLTQEKTVKRNTFLQNQDFSEFLEQARQGFYIPGLSQYMIPQGIAVSRDTGLTYISAYSISPLVSSVIAAVDTETGILKAEYWLYHGDGSLFSGHVGGVAAVGNYLYLSAEKDDSDGYQIAQINLGKLPRNGGCKLTLDTFVPVHTAPSFLSAFGDYLLVGNFYHPEGNYDLPDTLEHTVTACEGEQGSYILGYRITEQGGLTAQDDFPKAEFVLSAPDRIQGICCQEGIIYLSQSYGRRNNSSLLQYCAADLVTASEPITICGEQLPLYILDSRSLCDLLTAMPMTEGLCTGPDNKVIVLFESGAKKYDDGRDRTDTVWYLSIP